jgi:NAD(P)-dependent dehydrogenase (short-subunit alcohol dehydrogenase family)
MLLKDKVAVITGGAGRNGLGFATARQMAAQGARVAIVDLARAEPANAAAQLGEGHLGLVADVTDKGACDAAARAVLQAFGRIDILVNNAGDHAAGQDAGHHGRRLRPNPRREPPRLPVHVAGCPAGHA